MEPGVSNLNVLSGVDLNNFLNVKIRIPIKIERYNKLEFLTLAINGRIIKEWSIKKKVINIFLENKVKNASDISIVIIIAYHNGSDKL